MDCKPEHFLKWSHAYVYRQLGVTDNHDDLVQEMLIAMLRAEKSHDPSKGAKASWLVKAAEMRFKNVAFGTGRYTSSEASTRQRPVEEIHIERIQTSVQERIEPRTEDIADHVAVAYHRGEVRAALDRLTPRQREAVTCIMQDATMTGAQRAAWSGVRPQLATELSHLRSSE